MIRKIINRLRGEPQLEKLKKVGLKIGENFQYGNFCFFDPAHCFLISIGDDVTFSTRVHLLAHDASPKKLIGYVKIGRIEIGNHVFVGANTTILPGVTIGDNSIIGAGSVVTKDIPANSVACGIPARIVCSTFDYCSKVRLIPKELWFEEDYTIRGGITEGQKKEMLELLIDGKIGLVR